MNDYQIKIVNKLSEISDTNPEDWYLVSRARHGMEVVFSILGKSNDYGEVITQPFTCATAVNPILTVGLNPRYADISPETLSINPKSAGNLINDNTVAIVAQHTLGLRSQIHEISSLKKIGNFLIIEDSAHCLGRVSKDCADVSIHSFGSEKILDTSFGAAVWVNPDVKGNLLLNQIREHLNNLPKMSFRNNFRYAAYPFINKIINHAPRFAASHIKNILQKLGILVSPIMPIELRSKNFSKPEKLSLYLSKKALNSLKNLDGNNLKRLSASKIYLSLKNNLFTINNNDVYVRYPFVAETPEIADDIFHRLRSKNIAAGKWYRPLLFPGVDEDLYHYKKEYCPIAEKYSKLIVNLPTNIDETTAKEVINEINSIRAR